MPNRQPAVASFEDRLREAEERSDARLRELATVELISRFAYEVSNLRWASPGDPGLSGLHASSALHGALRSAGGIGDRLGAEGRTIPDTLHGLHFVAGGRYVTWEALFETLDATCSPEGPRPAGVFPDRARLPAGGSALGASQYDRHLAGREILGAVELGLAEIPTLLTTRDLTDGFTDQVRTLPRVRAEKSSYYRIADVALWWAGAVADRLREEGRAVPDTLDGLHYGSVLPGAVWVAAAPYRKPPPWQCRFGRRVFPPFFALGSVGSATGARHYKRRVARREILATFERALAELGVPRARDGGGRIRTSVG